MMMRIFIPINTPSSKNSKRWTGKFLIKSDLCQRYIKLTKKTWLEHAQEFRKLYDSLPKPVEIKFQFVRDSKRRFDYINIAQLPLDLMVEYSFIEDDNADCVIPVFEPYLYDKENPGVWITLGVVAG